jgi:hypothetical protein
LHLGEPYPCSIDVVRAEIGGGGEFAYRELSGIAHAIPTALIRRIREVALVGEGLREPHGLLLAA